MAAIGALALLAAACERLPAPPMADSRAAACADEDLAPSARIAACTAEIESGDLDDAGRAEALAFRAHARRAGGEVTEALRDYGAALELDPGQAEARAGRAAILLASGQLDAAEMLVAQLIADGQKQDQAQLMQGQIALRRGSTAAAIAAFDASLEANPRLALALAGRGRARQRDGDDSSALADYDAALEIDPTLPDARSGRCWLRLRTAREQDRRQRGDWIAQAREDADTAVEGDAQLVEAQLCRGVLQLRNREWGGARASFEAALAREPANPVALFGRGVARRRGGDDEGRDDMNRARDFDRHIGATFDDWGVDTY